MKFLFWNTHKNESINTTLSELIIENHVSIVILAEYFASIEELISILASNGIKMKHYYSGCDRIKLLGSLEGVELEPKRDTSNATIQIINGKDILCGVHLNCQLYSEHKEYREILIEQIVYDIQEVEKEIGTENSIVVGDFNINPYDSSCIDARYFHGIPVYNEAKRKSREVAGKKYFMFYNPMWNFLGDFKQPYGTYYHNNGTQNTYWNIFDQVIFRPVLRKRFVDKSFKILTETQTKYLLDRNGHPDKNISDHLPIIFEFQEEIYYGKES